MNINTVRVGDLVRESIFHRGADRDDGKSVWRYGIVVDELSIKGIVHDKMCKVCWSACPSFPVSSKAYTCFVQEKQLEVVS
jgi:hypothetical protein